MRLVRQYSSPDSRVTSCSSLHTTCRRGMDRNSRVLLTGQNPAKPASAMNGMKGNT